MITVLNSSKNQKSAEAFEHLSDKGLSLETCLRKTVILSEAQYESLKKESPELFKSFNVYSGFSGVEYLVKVLSGLESPVVGETEVLGQFKKQVVPQLKDKNEFSEVIQFVLNLVKMVRSKHLVGLGSQSYGSLVRRILKAEQHILFIGSGVLAESILPWVKDSKTVMFSVRSLKRYRNSELYKNNVDLKVFSLSEDFKFDLPLNVIVCAPIESKTLEAYLSSANVHKVIDLREESEGDPIKTLEGEIFDLKKVFKEVSDQTLKKENLLKAVNVDINRKIEEKFVKHRPFGWDDLCL